MNTNRGPAAYGAFLLGLLGFGLLALSWVGASGKTELADQKGYLLVATLGLLTAAAGATVSLSAQRHRLAARTADITDRMAGWLDEGGQASAEFGPGGGRSAVMPTGLEGGAS